MGSDPEKHFPFEVMKEHFRKFGKFGLILASVLLPIITQESGSGWDLDEMAEKITENNGQMDMELFDSIFTDKSRTKFNKRLRDVVVDMVRLEYIWKCRQ